MNYNPNINGASGVGSMQDSTPISALPDMGGGGSAMFSGGGGGGSGVPVQPNANVYMPLNAHKNPFVDGQPTTPGMPTMGTRGAAPPTLDEAMQYSLPSRDIPQQQDRFSHDEYIKPGYIPGENAEDYIPDEMSRIRDRRRKREKQVRFQEDTLVDIQQPFILALVFFIFQLPVVNNMICKHFGAFGFAGLDGNISIAGLFLKSIVFGGIVYGYKYLMGGEFLL